MKILLLILPLFLVGCGHTQVEYEPVPLFVPVVCEDPEQIESIIPEPVVYVKALDAQGNVVAGLDGESVSNLTINRADTLRYIKEQKGTISYYKKCIEIHNSVH